MASNYACCESTKHVVENARITITYLRRTPEENSSHVPSWEKFMHDEVLQMTTKLVKMSKQNPNADFAISADSGLTNGLAIELHIAGIEVSEDNKRNYLRRVKQYLRRMSKAVHVVVQTTRVESSRLGGQEQSRVSNTRAIQNETPHMGFYCKDLSVFGSVIIVPNDVPLEQDNSITGLYEDGGHIPSAFVQSMRIPLSCFQEIVPVFVPQCSFYPYVVPSSHLRTAKIHLMVATPDFPGCRTGLLPFLFDSDDVQRLLQAIFSSVQKMRINPPVVNRRAPQEIRTAGSSPWTASGSDFPTLPTRTEGLPSHNTNVDPTDVVFQEASSNDYKRQ